MATQTLPNGYCGLPIQKSCPHANACLTCPVFLSGPEFLPELREQRHRTLTLIEVSTGKGQTRVAEMNQQVLTNLNRMIGEIENDREDEERTEAADARRPPASADWRPTTSNSATHSPGHSANSAPLRCSDRQ